MSQSLRGSMRRRSARVDCCLRRERADHRAGPPWFLLANDPSHLVEGRLLQPLFLKRRRAGQQLVQQDAQRIDIAAGIDVDHAQARLLGTHVQRCPDHLRELGIDRLFGQLLVQRLGDAKVDHLGNGHAIDFGDQDVGWFEVAVNDSLLMGMLNGTAHRGETTRDAREWSAAAGRSIR